MLTIEERVNALKNSTDRLDAVKTIGLFLAELEKGTVRAATRDAGRPFVVGVAELSARFPQHAHLIQAYQEHWEESVGLPIQGSIRLLRQLKSRGYPVYGLSNWSAETFPIIRSRYDFFELLDGYVISGDVGTVKPDPEIFLALLRRIGRPADECLFIDDSAVNIRAASELGFNSILFESPEQLEARLQHLGIL